MLLIPTFCCAWKAVPVKLKQVSPNSFFDNCRGSPRFQGSRVVSQGLHEAQSKISAAQKKVVEQKNVDKTNLLVSIMKEIVLEKGKTGGTGAFTVTFDGRGITSTEEGNRTLANLFEGFNRTHFESSMKEWAHSLGYAAEFGRGFFGGYGRAPILTLKPE